MNLNHLKVLLLFLVLINHVVISQSDCHPKPKDFQLVYDQANLFSSSDERLLNEQLNSFTKQTSNVVVVLTTDDLCGYDKAEYTYSFGDKMGVGRADLDNGVVVMVKPKIQSERGEAFIAVGTGLQGAIPDILAGRIIQNEMIPAFKRNDYSGGIRKGCETIMALASGEISEAEYGASSKKDHSGGNAFVAILVILGIIFLFGFIFRRSGGNGDDWENFGGGGKRTGRRSSGGWIYIGGGSGWGGGSSSGGGFGGGGFGGFGGGGFDGGGAGGSW